jgi:hypothetical protein
MAVRVFLSLLSGVHLLFGITLLVLSMALPERSLTITMRRQFDDWGPLFQLYRSDAPPVDMRQTLLSLAWCNTSLPPGTVRAPYCDCISLQHALYLEAAGNGSGPPPLPVRESAVRGLVGCLAARPVWRVWPVWSVNPVTPALYILLVSACFLWVAADLPYPWTRWLLWLVALAVAILLGVHSPYENCLWAATIPSVTILIEFVMLPGMAEYSSSRYPGCFWWCEYLCAPVFSLFVPLMHNGRDIFCVAVTIALGSTLGALGLRSFWCTYSYTNTSFYRDIHLLLFVAISVTSAALLSLAGVYYNPDTPFLLGRASVVLLAATTALPLLQAIPMNEGNRLVLQVGIAAARNVVLFAFTAWDAR